MAGRPAVSLPFSEAPVSEFVLNILLGFDAMRRNLDLAVSALALPLALITVFDDVVREICPPSVVAVV